jgi:glutamyl-tRNA(Gln) amidotransferase subunit D
MTSQCLYGRTNLNVYSTGRQLLKTGVIPAGDMLPETAYVKLVWAMGQTQDLDGVRKVMHSNLRGELGDKSSSQYFLKDYGE